MNGLKHDGKQEAIEWSWWCWLCGLGLFILRTRGTGVEHTGTACHSRKVSAYSGEMSVGGGCGVWVVYLDTNFWYYEVLKYDESLPTAIDQYLIEWSVFAPLDGRHPRHLVSAWLRRKPSTLAHVAHCDVFRKGYTRPSVVGTYECTHEGESQHTLTES